MVSQPIVTRKEAKERGLPRYFTGKPCKYGHVCERYTAGRCVTCAVDTSVVWNAAHPDKRRKGSTDYALRNKEKVKVRRAAHRVANRDRLNASKNAWHLANTDRVREYSRQYIAANHDRRATQERNRRARKRSADGSHTLADIDALRIAQGNLCAACSADMAVTGSHVDHKTPLVRGGGNGPDNLILLCPPCNQRKYTKTLDEFMVARDAAF